MNDDNFFSINRLVEFGMGMAMAQQMTRMMNDVVNQTIVPGAGRIIPPKSAMPIYVVVDDKPVGPLAEKDFIQLVNDKKVDKSTLAWTPGMSEWKSIADVPQILKIMLLTPPPIPGKQ